MFCSCDNSLGNLGNPSCDTLQSVTKKLIYVPMYNSAGVRNAILSSDVLDASYISAKINHTDESMRWYPSPIIENVEDTKAEPIFESLNSGSNVFIQEGVRTFTGVHIKQSSVFLGKLKSGKCVSFGVYMIDNDGSLTGSVSTDGTMLYPIAVDKDTFQPILVKATDTTVAKVQVSFEFSRIEKDENLRTIGANLITVDMLSVNGLMDGYVAVSNDTTTGVTATISTSYGSFGSPIKIQGLVLADFAVFNVTDNASVTVTSVTESAPGVYDLAFAAQTVADSMRLTVTKAGFDIEVATWVI